MKKTKKKEVHSMKDISYRRLRPEADACLRDTGYSPRRLVLIHSGITLGVGLVLSVLSYLLDLGIAQTGGLGGIGQRTTLESIQTILSLGCSILLPFWEIGFLYVALQLARRQSPSATSLLEGFRHWGVVLRGMVLKCVLAMIVMFFAAQMVSILYLMTPGATQLRAIMLGMTASGVTDPSAMLENETYVQLMMQAMPFLLIGTSLPLLALLYLLRFTDFILMAQPQKSALFAVIGSIRITARNWKSLIRLDLRFWWYFALEVLAVVISYGHLILELLQVDIGIGGDTAMFVFYILSLAGQLALYVWQKAAFRTTYALALDTLCQPEEPITE